MRAFRIFLWPLNNCLPLLSNTSHQCNVFYADQQPVDKFVVLASDGVWEFISSQEAVDIVNASLGEGTMKVRVSRGAFKYIYKYIFTLHDASRHHLLGLLRLKRYLG